MLAQNFKTPADLGISDAEFEALVKVLGKLNAGEITPSQFDMENYQNACGTIGCLCGWANIVSGGNAFPELTEFKDRQYEATVPLIRRLPRPAQELFGLDAGWNLCGVTPDQAATVLREYLVTGDTDWDAVMENE